MPGARYCAFSSESQRSVESLFGTPAPRLCVETIHSAFDGLFREKHFMVACTTQSAGTSVRRKGIEFRSTGADMPGKLHQCQTCSTRVRSHKTRGLPFAATSRTTGSGCAGQTARALAQPRAQAQWWEY